MVLQPTIPSSHRRLGTNHCPGTFQLWCQIRNTEAPRLVDRVTTGCRVFPPPASGPQETAIVGLLLPLFRVEPQGPSNYHVLDFSGVILLQFLC